MSDKTLHNYEVEQSLLGALILDNSNISEKSTETEVETAIVKAVAEGGTSICGTVYSKNGNIKILVGDTDFHILLTL